nr:DUF3127 domain-containing protein [Bacteroidales bacterium]
IIDVLALQTGNGRNGEWKKQEFILETQGQFPKKVCIAVWGDKIQPTVLQKGNKITAQFDIESREYMGRWYTEAKAWKVELTQTSQTSNQTEQIPPNFDAPFPSQDDFLMPQQNDEELPF